MAQMNLLPDSRGEVTCHCWWCASTGKVLNSAGNKESLSSFLSEISENQLQECLRWLQTDQTNSNKANGNDCSLLEGDVGDVAHLQTAV